MRISPSPFSVRRTRNEHDAKIPGFIGDQDDLTESGACRWGHFLAGPQRQTGPARERFGPGAQHGEGERTVKHISLKKRGKKRGEPDENRNQPTLGYRQ